MRSMRLRLLMIPPLVPRRVKWGWWSSVNVSRTASVSLATVLRSWVKLPSTGLSRGSSEAVQFQSPPTMVWATSRGARN